MGLSLNQAMLLREWKARWGLRGPALSLGVVDLRFGWSEFAGAAGLPVGSAPPDIDDRSFFSVLDLGPLTRIDITDAEGAEILVDLSCADPPEALLGPPHTDHHRIRTVGVGGYSHWERMLLFSTPDGSAPDRNGGRYVAHIPIEAERR